MTNRKKIEKFCKENGLQIESLTFERNTDAEYGDTWDASYWDLNIIYSGKKVNYDFYRGFGVNEDVDLTLKCIKDDIESGEILC